MAGRSQPAYQTRVAVRRASLVAGACGERAWPGVDAEQRRGRRFAGGARPPDNVMLLSECLERVGSDERVANGNVRMDVVIQRPERFITDDDLREMVLSLPECQTYALVYRAVPLLRGHQITSLLQWGGADENADAKRAVRDALGG
ncbi:putative retrotransposon hot spot protein 4 (RHS4) [Trypanosoma vivax]|nr:putative retrotransposon hot spot protein 4 (RHS4) [Trypanosoma vivax]